MATGCCKASAAASYRLVVLECQSVWSQTTALPCGKTIETLPSVLPVPSCQHQTESGLLNVWELTQRSPLVCSITQLQLDLALQGSYEAFAGVLDVVSSSSHAVLKTPHRGTPQ